MVLGVSEWVAQRMNFDVGYVRIGFVILASMGSGVLLYLILYFAMISEK